MQRFILAPAITVGSWNYGEKVELAELWAVNRALEDFDKKVPAKRLPENDGTERSNA